MGGSDPSFHPSFHPSILIRQADQTKWLMQAGAIIIMGGGVGGDFQNNENAGQCGVRATILYHCEISVGISKNNVDNIIR